MQETSKNRPKHRTFVFEGFELDEKFCTLTRAGERLSLRPKSFDMLAYLLERRGELVSKDEILLTLWPDVVVTEDSLTQCLGDIRKVLDDRDRRIVQTVRGRGYLLDVPVEVRREEDTPASTEKISSKGWKWIVTISLFLTLAAALNWMLSDSSEQETVHSAKAPGPPNSIAVLAFRDMSPKGDHGYFAEGMSEEILNQLAKNPDLIVIARTSSFMFNDRSDDIPTIAEKLRVANVLEGSVRISGDRVRVTAQLIDVNSGAHLWSETFDRTVGDDITIQSSIARHVAETLNARILDVPSDGTPRRIDFVAMDHYLKGRFFHNRRAPGDLDLAVAEFERAVAIQPDFADAWVGLAGSIRVTAYVEGTPYEEIADSVKFFLDRALESDPQNAAALSRLAGYYYETGNLKAAEEAFNFAIQGGWNEPLVMSSAAGALFHQSRYQEAVAMARRATTLDPLSAVYQENLAYYLFYANRLEESREAYLAAAQLSGGPLPNANDHLVSIAALTGRIEEANSILVRTPEGPVKDLGRALIFHLQGKESEAEAAVHALSAQPGAETSRYLAEIFAFMGDTDASFLWLDDSIEQLDVFMEDNARLNFIQSLLSSPLLRSVREDARWKDRRDRLLAEIGWQPKLVIPDFLVD